MKNRRLTILVFLALVFASPSYADPPERIQEKIRKEYRGAAAPDHLIFAFELLAISATADSDRTFALRMVQQGMQFDSQGTTEAFLSQMIAAADDLESDYNRVSDTLLCGPGAPRAKEALYQLLDKVDDLREIKAHNAYVKFISKLDKSQQGALSNWLEKSKEGFYYRTAEHESSFEGVGVDVVNHVNMVCALRENER